MTDVFIDKRTNLVKPAVYPCYKAPETYKCQLRRTKDGHFECCKEPVTCSFKTRVT